jgi:hypothetical protein
MKKFISIAVPLLAALAMLAGCAGAQQPQPPVVSNAPVEQAAAAPASAPAVVLPQFDPNAVFEWKHFGTDPFAKTRGEAMAQRAEAFRMLGVPDECMAQAMQATDAPSTMEHLNVGDQLLAMLSGGHKVHRNTVVKFSKPPVKKNGIDYAASVETWTFDCQGTTIKLGLPEVCNNWSLYPPLSRFTVAEGSCPTVNTLKVNVWPKDVFGMFPDLRKAVNAEEETTRFLGHSRVSADFGGRFRQAMKQGNLLRDDKKRLFDVWYIMTPEAHGKPDPSITQSKYLGRVPVQGLAELQLRKVDTDYWDAVRLVPAGDRDYVYTPLFEDTGVHELRFFNKLPDNPSGHGEWDNNPVPDCLMNVHYVADDHDTLIPLM